jgi:hypothetical protein
MPKSITLKPNKDNAYHLDVEVEGEKKSALIDTGTYGPDGTVNILIDKKNFDKIKHKLKKKGKTKCGEDATGTPLEGEYGTGTVKVPGLDVEVEKIIAYRTLAETIVIGTTFYII